MYCIVSRNVRQNTSVSLCLRDGLAMRWVIIWLATLYICKFTFRVFIHKYLNTWWRWSFSALEVFIDNTSFVVGWVILRGESTFCREIAWVVAIRWVVIWAAADTERLVTIICVSMAGLLARLRQNDWARGSNVNATPPRPGNIF